MASLSTSSVKMLAPTALSCDQKWSMPSTRSTAFRIPRRSTAGRVQASIKPAAATATGESTAVDASRLVPRVEERDGYWILKEEFRQGINPQEKIKIEKEPMKLISEAGISELAKLSMEEIDQNKLTKDDIDVRLKWLGLFHRRKHQYGRFMMRLKLPNGVK